MLRLRRHIIAEIIETFFAVIVSLILIMISFQFAKLLGYAALGKISGGSIYKLVLLQTINLFILLAPFAFFIGMLIALNKMASHHELIAMRSLGFGDKKMYESLFTLAAPLALIIAYLSIFTLPSTLALNAEIKDQAANESKMSIIQSGQFRNIGKGTTIYAANSEGQSFNQLFVWQNNTKQTTITLAQSGRQTTKDEKPVISLLNGQRVIHKKDNQKTQIFSFKQLDAFLPDAERTNRKKKLKALPTKELLSNPTLENRIELQRRVSPALSILLLTLFAPLLIQINPRQNRYGKFVFAIIIYAIYANSQVALQTLIEKQWLPIIPGVYSAHVLFAVIAGIWIWRNNNRKIQEPSK